MPQTSPTTPTVAVLTALPLEYDAVLSHLTDIEQLEHPHGTRARRGRLPNTPWHVALVNVGTGTLAAAALTERVLEWLKPQAVLLVGIAGGLKDDIEIGDVVVATKVYAIHGGKQTADGFQVRPEAWHASHRLEQAAKEALRDRAHFKPIAVGDVVLADADSELAARIRRSYNDAVAIDMEGSGVAHAVHLAGGADALVIRGVSDKADAAKSAEDAKGSQSRAAANAASAAVDVLRELEPKPAAPEPQVDPARRGPVDDALAEKADLLAREVETRLKKEEEEQRIWDPHPLPVRWQPAPDELTGGSGNNRIVAAEAADASPLDLAGPLDDFAAFYKRTRSGWFMVLGSAGSGKSILALRFARARLKTPPDPDHAPVPVIFSLGSWNPEVTRLLEWMVDRLERDQPFLAGTGPDGSTWAAALFKAGYVLPILDGFDEIAEGLRKRALQVLNGSTLPLLVTSRRDALEAAVRTTKVVPAAAGIELPGLTLDDSLDYLADATNTSPSDGTDTAATTGWGVRTERDAPASPDPGRGPSRRRADHPPDGHARPHRLRIRARPVGAAGDRAVQHPRRP
ncbi:NACHT domain-containing protein [Streptomyces sp. ME18-1-4]|uniref:phosphorylase family protein n=1 Tax=Streptomyces sp. ME18-1-4 TaxID=3028685 RepID=UPI0029CA6BDA|nr:NACHT domain-containing protein [Streptomyces sp. ME18-1-4]